MAFFQNLGLIGISHLHSRFTKLNTENMILLLLVIKVKLNDQKKGHFLRSKIFFLMSVSSLLV